MDLSRKVTLNTFAQIVGRAGVILISLITTAILTRNLGRTGYGAFGVINTAVVIFFSFADWGTNIIAVRETSRTPERGGQIFGNCLILRGLMAFLGIGTFWLFILLNPTLAGFKKEALVSSLIILFFSFKTSAQIVFHSKLRLHLTALVELVAAASFLFFLTILKDSFSLLWVIYLLVISAALSALLAILISLKITSVDFRLDFNLLKHLAKESLPMGALMATFSVYNRIDTFILQAIKGEAETGLYVLAYKVHDNLVLGAAYLMNSFFPVISNLPIQGSKENSLEIVLQKAFDLLLAMALPMTVLVFILAPMIIDLLGGENFFASSIALRILIFATGIAYLNHLTGYSLVALGRQRVHLKFGFITLLLNVILNLILVTKYSFIGAAVVTVFTEFFIFLLTFLYLRKALGIRLSFVSFPQTFWRLIVQKGKVF